MRTIARMAAVRPLPVRLEDGSCPVVVALPSDRVGDVEARRERMGGHVNVFVAYPDRLLQLSMREMPDDDDTADVSPSSSMDMLVTWLTSTTTGTGSIRLTQPRHAAPIVEELQYAF